MPLDLASASISSGSYPINFGSYEFMAKVSVYGTPINQENRFPIYGIPLRILLANSGIGNIGTNRAIAEAFFNKNSSLPGIEGSVVRINNVTTVLAPKTLDSLRSFLANGGPDDLTRNKGISRAFGELEKMIGEPMYFLVLRGTDGSTKLVPHWKDKNGFHIVKDGLVYSHPDQRTLIENIPHTTAFIQVLDTQGGRILTIERPHGTSYNLFNDKDLNPWKQLSDSSPQNLEIGITQDGIKATLHAQLGPSLWADYAWSSSASGSHGNNVGVSYGFKNPDYDFKGRVGFGQATTALGEKTSGFQATFSARHKVLDNIHAILSGDMRIQGSFGRKIEIDTASGELAWKVAYKTNTVFFALGQKGVWSPNIVEGNYGKIETRPMITAGLRGDGWMATAAGSLDNKKISFTREEKGYNINFSGEYQHGIGSLPSTKALFFGVEIQL